MNLMNQMMSYDKNKNVIQESCECEKCTNSKVETQIIEYPPLTEEEIGQIVNERYSDKDEKTKIFIRKALQKHGDRYDYSNVIYIKSNEDVEIICRVEGHKAFPQTPHNHLSGRGCKICGYEKLANDNRLTLEEFIEKANEVHGIGRYDYSKVEYIDYHTDVIIICPKHGDFPQIPNNHLIGKGCRFCANEKLANERRKPLEKFIAESNEVHGEGTYDYSKVIYVNYDTDVIIICPIHGDFPQTPYNHLRGQGCPKCNSSKGEISVRNFLIENKIEFEEQKRFNDCRNKNPLPFDFYVPKYNLCIEYDGEQHFVPHDFTSRKASEDVKLENLKSIQHRDEIKNNYCKQKGIHLLRIRYDENVENKLTKYFSENNII